MFKVQGATSAGDARRRARHKAGDRYEVRNIRPTREGDGYYAVLVEKGA